MKLITAKPNKETMFEICFSEKCSYIGHLPKDLILEPSLQLPGINPWGQLKNLDIEVIEDFVVIDENRDTLLKYFTSKLAPKESRYSYELKAPLHIPVGSPIDCIEFQEVEWFTEEIYSRLLINSLYEEFNSSLFKACDWIENYSIYRVGDQLSMMIEIKDYEENDQIQMLNDAAERALAFKAIENNLANRASLFSRFYCAGEDSYETLLEEALKDGYANPLELTKNIINIHAYCQKNSAMILSAFAKDLVDNEPSTIEEAFNCLIFSSAALLTTILSMWEATTGISFETVERKSAEDDDSAKYYDDLLEMAVKFEATIIEEASFTLPDPGEYID